MLPSLHLKPIVLKAAPAGAITLAAPRLVLCGATTPQAKRRFYAPELDALRFGAFMMVFCRHVVTQFSAVQRNLQPGQTLPATLVTSSSMMAAHTALGFFGQAPWSLLQGLMQSMDFGVCLFFFLSSFLITRLLLMEREATGSVAVGAFYVRRSLRIWPLYFTFLVFVIALAQAFPVLHAERSRVLVSVLFVANWAAVLHGWASISIQPLWSISVEEQFYLVWPWLARGGRSAILKASLIFASVSLVTLLYLGNRPGMVVTKTWPNTLVQMLFFAGGAWTAVLSKPETRRLKIWHRCAALLAGLLAWVIASAGFHVVRTESPGAISLIVGYLLVLLGVYLIFIAVAGWSATQVPRWLIHLGRISYGLYVFHVVCLVLSEQAMMPLLLRHRHGGRSSLFLAELVVALVGLLMTMICALLSYTLLEKQFLKLKGAFAVISTRSA